MEYRQYKNTTPDSQGVSKEYIHLIIKGQTVNHERIEPGSLHLHGSTLANEFGRITRASNCTRGFIVTYHGKNRRGEFYPHLHVLYWHSKDNKYWGQIRQLLHRTGAKYEWSVVQSIVAVSKYLQASESREILGIEAGPLQPSGLTGMDDLGAESEALFERGCGVQEHNVRDGEPSTSTRFRANEASDTDSDNDYDGLRRTSRRKVQGPVEKIYKALEVLQSSSVSDFKQAVYCMDEYKHLEPLFISKNFTKFFAVAHEKICFRYRDKSWEESLQLFNIDTLERQHGKFLSPNESVAWIKEWLTFNNIDIKQFVTQAKCVLDKERVKLNSLQFHGPPNSFKTVIASSLCRSKIFYFNNNQLNGRTSQFGLQEAVDKAIAFLDEISVDDSWKEKFLLLLGGSVCNTDKKFEAPQQINRVPVILCFNKDVTGNLLPRDREYYGDAVRKRGFYYRLKSFPRGKYCAGHLHPWAWWLLLREYKLLVRPDAERHFIETYSYPEGDQFVLGEIPRTEFGTPDSKRARYNAAGIEEELERGSEGRASSVGTPTTPHSAERQQKDIFGPGPSEQSYFAPSPSVVDDSEPDVVDDAAL